MDRKKPCRTAKAALIVRPTDEDESINDDLSGVAALVAISPVDEEINMASPTAATTAATDSVECRRSSRKKIPKFDVRDLLLKQHRKPHKIQIEARIDSNAPSTSRTNNASSSRNLDKCFIEKTSIIQRTPTVAQVPIPITTEIFKPSQTSSLIVAQMESSPSLSQKEQKHVLKPERTLSLPSTKQFVTSKRIDSDVNVPKRRGRPPRKSLAEKLPEKNTADKTDTAVESTVESTWKKDEFVTGIDEIESRKKSVTVSNLKCDENISETENKAVEENKVVCSNYGLKMSVKMLMEAETTYEQLINSKIDSTTSNTTKANVAESFSVDSDKNANSSKDNQLSLEIGLIKKSDLSVVENKKETNKQAALEEPTPSTFSSKMSEILPTPTSSIESATKISMESKFEEKDIKLLMNKEEAAELIFEEQIKPASDSPTFISKDLEQLKPTASPPRKTSTPTPRRCERRSGRRLDDATNCKTLEETFAEIAAKSSKAILEQAIQKSSDESNESIFNLKIEKLNDESKDEIKDVRRQTASDDSKDFDEPNAQKLYNESSNTIKSQSVELEPKSVEFTSESQKSFETQTFDNESKPAAAIERGAAPSKKRCRKSQTKMSNVDESQVEEESLKTQSYILDTENVCGRTTVEDKTTSYQQEGLTQSTTPIITVEVQKILSEEAKSSDVGTITVSTFQKASNETTEIKEKLEDNNDTTTSYILENIPNAAYKSDSTQRNEPRSVFENEKQAATSESVAGNKKDILDSNPLFAENEKNQYGSRTKKSKIGGLEDKDNSTMDNDSSASSEMADSLVKNERLKIKSREKSKGQLKETYQNRRQRDSREILTEKLEEKTFDLFANTKVEEKAAEKTSQLFVDKEYTFQQKADVEERCVDESQIEEKSTIKTATSIKESTTACSEAVFVEADKSVTHETPIFMESKEDKFVSEESKEEKLMSEESKEEKLICKEPIEDTTIFKEFHKSEEVKETLKTFKNISNDKHDASTKKSQDGEKIKNPEIETIGSFQESDVSKIEVSDSNKKIEHKYETIKNKESETEGLMGKIKSKGHISEGNIMDDAINHKKKYIHKMESEEKEKLKKQQISTSKSVAIKEKSISLENPNKHGHKESTKKIKDKNTAVDKEKHQKLKDNVGADGKEAKKKTEKSSTDSKELSKKQRTDKSAEKLGSKLKEKSKVDVNLETKSENIQAASSMISKQSKDSNEQLYMNNDSGILETEDKSSKTKPDESGKIESAKETTKQDTKSNKRKLKEKQESSSIELSAKDKHKFEKHTRKIKANESEMPIASSTPMMGNMETPMALPLQTFLKNADSSSQQKLKKRKDSWEPTECRGVEQSLDKEMRKTEKNSSKSKEAERNKQKLKDKDKQVRKERQRKLEAALVSALETKIEAKSSESVTENYQLNTPAATEQQLPFTDLEMPPTPGSIKSVNLDSSTILSTEMSNKSDTEPDPFYDIAKFIEDGVNLLKRDYKLTENEELVEQNVENTKKSTEKAEHIIDQTAALHAENSDTSSTKPTIDLYETPANTPATTPGSTTPSSSPIPTDNADNSLDTYYYSDGKRRSHRLKKITSAPKALEGRGLAKLHYNIEDHLTDLAEVEAKNAQFLKDMEERLSNFKVIKESEYHCERLISREARKMICDCFLTPEEAERGELGCGEDCLNRLLMIECGANCKVGERCTNNRFQKILCAPCRVFRTEKKGFGIMADVEIHPGEFIMEYVGEVLDSDEFEERRLAYSKEKNRHYYFMELRRDAIIDATTKGNISRFINHSCDPNAETQKWTVNGELRIGFFSRKSIAPGEEITFDYQYQRYGREAQRCYCESANCRGWIGEEPDSEEGEQADDDDEEDEEDEEEEEDEEVTSLVKNLLNVDNSDQILDKQPSEAELLKRKTNSSNSSENQSTALEIGSDESKKKFLSILGKITAKLDITNKQSKLEEKKLRKKRKRKQVAEKKRSKATGGSRFLEDPDLEDEIDFLSRCGLKNQSDTLRFSRLMVRAKLISTRLNLLTILRAGELPCRRLFLDYHGLHLLHGWMNEDGRTDMTMRLALLQTLECLPVANKTMLTDSKVYQALHGWCSTEKQASLSASTTGATEASSLSSPSDESSKESAEQKCLKDNETGARFEEIEKSAAKLLTTWDNLPEIFRIPKRERIEQMKEHEREADRQYAATIEANESVQKITSSTDRYQRDRFERRFGKQHGIRSISGYGGPGSGSGSNNGGPGSSYKKNRLLLSEDTKNMSKEQRRELFAAKVAHEEAEKRMAERRREFETKCNFFGLDPRKTQAENLPFCVSDSGQWFNELRQAIATPPSFAHVQTPIKPKSTNPADYYLPKAASNLPPEWAFAITDQGKIYYYHLKHRIPQWEPPTSEQVNQTKWSETESESDYDEEEVGAEDITEERIKEIESIQSQEELSAFLKKIAKEQRQARYKRLVEERPISPRREEDRIYNQLEMRKYKENKEKIKKRKEEIRRRRSEAAKNSAQYMCTLGSLLDVACKASTSAEGAKITESVDMPDGALPIQDYLLSSDDEVAHDQDIDEMKAECNNSPLLEKIVQGDKIVDELDALTTKRQLKRPLPPHRDLSFDLNSVGNDGTGATTTAAGISSDNSHSSSIDKIEYKRRRQEKKERSKRSRDSGDSKYRKLKEKFRCEIAGIIVHHLKSYRKESCTFGRIRSNEDFNHLAKKLTHFVMVKELKYCDAVGQTLVVTDSVKNKSREFIKKYMAKYENGYVKPVDDPEFKDIPFTL